MKIRKFIYNPTFFYSVWLIYILLPLIYFLRFYLEKSILSQERWISHTLSIFITLSNYIPGLLVLLFILQFRKLYLKKLSKRSRKILGIFLTLSLACVFLGIIYLTIEQNNYPNYLYANFGIPYDVLDLIVKLNIFLSVTIYFITINQGAEIENLIKLLTVFAFIVLIYQSFYPIANARKLIYESSVGPFIKYGSDYKYISYIKSSVPQNSNFIHPPQADLLPFFSNQPMLRYFLFPRTLISGSVVNKQTIITIKEAYFVDLGEYSKGLSWPILNSQDKTITFDYKNYVRYNNLSLVSQQVHLYKIDF